jgi:hypothetical protein
MSTEDDYWPDDLVKDVPNVPVEILKQQASLLGGKTGNTVVADVESYVDGDGDFMIKFSIRAPALSNYSYELFRVWHNAELYPLSIWGVSDVSLNNEKELRDFIRGQLQSEKTVRIVRALVSQARQQAK